MLKFELENRNVKNAISKNEFRYVKDNYYIIVKTLKELLKTDFDTIAIYNYTSSIMPGFYERFYFHYRYLTLTDARKEQYKNKNMNESLEYCKKYFETLHRPDLAIKYLNTFPTIMFQTYKLGHYGFFFYELDKAILDFIIFINKFSDFKKFQSKCVIFLQLLNVQGGDYEDGYKWLISKDGLFGNTLIERY